MWKEHLTLFTLIDASTETASHYITLKFFNFASQIYRLLCSRFIVVIDIYNWYITSYHPEVKWGLTNYSQVWREKKKTHSKWSKQHTLRAVKKVGADGKPHVFFPPWTRTREDVRLEVGGTQDGSGWTKWMSARWNMLKILPPTGVADCDPEPMKGEN